jgi:hypothetical protein
MNRAKGPPAPLLRCVGPVLLAAPVVLVASGVVLLPWPAFGGNLKSIHGASSTDGPFWSSSSSGRNGETCAGWR